MALTQSLPITVLLLMLETVVGGTLVLLFTDFEARASSGFLITSGLIFAVGAGLAYLLRFGYGSAAPTLGPLVAGLTGLLVVYAVLVMLKRRAVARVIGAASVAVGAAVLFRSALLQPSFAAGADLLSLVLATLVLGAAMTALLLGHWYLVTPLLSAQSLRRVTGILLVGLALQVILVIAAFIPVGSGTAVADRATLLLSTYSFVFWFRVIVGLAFPIALGILTWRSCRLRAMQTATGLLYIVVGCVLAGQTAAQALLVLTTVSL
ncbi:MAG TPA: hypothetical protein VNL16_16935 [Chloroflexota bacterium]|nr:hypothetical protein [Chloroflexota bacterium]